MQGFELANVRGAMSELDKSKDGTQSYFSELGGFRSIGQQPQLKKKP